MEQRWKTKERLRVRKRSGTEPGWRSRRQKERTDSRPILKGRAWRALAIMMMTKKEKLGDRKIKEEREREGGARDKEAAQREARMGERVGGRATVR